MRNLKSHTHITYTTPYTVLDLSYVMNYDTRVEIETRETDSRQT